MAEAARGEVDAGAGLSVLVVGMSNTRICGARDHATVLAGELRSRGMSCTICWLGHEQRSLIGAGKVVRAWLRELALELSIVKPDVVILHYSVFAFSFRGVPLFVGPVTAALRRAKAPVVTIVHEAVYAAKGGGRKGRLWALPHRAALIELMRLSAAVVVTADFRARWISSRRWLPKRPLAVAPVFSNLPAPAGGADTMRETGLVGLFGYSYEGSSLSTVLDALVLLRGEAAPGARLVLLGAPGRESSSGAAWLASARQRGLLDALSFSGRLPAQELSNCLAACDVLIFADRGGPSSRKGSLAAALASGSPVVALDGPYTWSELRDGESIRLVERTPQALAEAIAGLLDDRALNERIGDAGRRFADREMGIDMTVRALMGLLEPMGVLG